MSSPDVRGLSTQADLCAAYDVWLAPRGYPRLSADELYYELLDKDPRPENDLVWLAGFINRWEIVVEGDKPFPWESMCYRTTADPDYDT